jgi:hypothetical protein
MAFKPGTMFVYIAESPFQLATITDVNVICKPDFILECAWPEEWYQSEWLERVQLQHDTFQPRLGTYIVSMQQPSPGKEDKSGEFNVVSVGLERSNLSAIVNILLG